MSKSVHIAIIREVCEGKEAEFETELRQFLSQSLGVPGVMGTHIVAPPDSGNREFGILRTFSSEKAMKEFYASRLFLDWDRKVRPLTVGEPEMRRLHGLEAWFRTTGTPPPRWKMAMVTLMAVLPVSALLSHTVGPFIRPWHPMVQQLTIGACMVVILTWAAMPLMARIFRQWLHPEDESPF